MQNMEQPEKKIRKKTLKKRIFRFMSISNLITILILSATIFILSILLIQGMMGSMSYFISHNIKNEMSSHEFLRQMKITNLEDISTDSVHYKRWAQQLNAMQSIDISTLEPLQIKLSEEGLNLSRLYFAAVTIEINGNILYETDSNIDSLPDLDKQTIQRQQDKNQWIAKSIENTQVVLPLTNQAGEEIGTITTNLEPNLLFILFITLIIVIIIISILTFIISKFLMRFFAIPLLNPLKELQEKLDELAKQDVTDGFVKPIAFKKPLFEIWKLADATNNIIYKMKNYTDLLEQHKDELEQQKEELELTTEKLMHSNTDLERKNNQLENILNNVSQGFLTFGYDLKVKEEYSLACKQIFEKDIEFAYIPELLFPGEVEEIKFLDEIFRKILIGDDPTKIHLCIPLLPEEIIINGKNIHLNYKLVKDSANKDTNEMMVILNDITEKKSLEKQMDEERRRLKMVVKVISNQETFLEIIDDFHDFYQRKLTDITDVDVGFEAAYSEIYRQIHTFKGNFSQFDMNNLVDRLHEIETKLSANKKVLKESGCLEVKKMLRNENLQLLLDTDIKILEHYLGNDFFNQKHMLKIDKDRVIEIENKIIQILPNNESKQLLPYVRKLRYKSLKELLKSYTDYVVKLSERQQKLVNPFEITGADLYIDEERYQNFIKSIVHIFRNCVDHGIEEPEQRVVVGKHEIGNIKCHIEDNGSFIKMTISDDGKGINFDEIKEKLVADNPYSIDTVNMLREDQLLEVIFKDTFSTRTYADDVSGRGVGLSVVENELESIGGSVEVQTGANEGTSFIFTIPIFEEKETMPVFIEPLLEALKTNAIKFVIDHSSIELSPVAKGFEVTEKITLSTITALINMRGSINAIFALSINEDLASKLLKGFVIGELAPEEEDLAMEDTLSEISNIILGNSVKVFDSMKHIVNFGVPTILCHKGASIKNIGASIITTKLKKNQYEMSVSLISMDNELIEEE